MILSVTIVIAVAVVAVAAIVTGHKVTLSFRDIKATVERNEEHTVALKETVGEANGNGDVATMLARGLDEIAELDRKVSAVDERLDARTHVTRTGHEDPEELAVYTQDRMHDILNLLAVIKLQVDTIWQALKADYDLPDLQSLIVPTVEEKV